MGGDATEQDKTTRHDAPGEERAFDKEDERALKEFDFYHGFIPRDDLQFLIKNEGDFLLRVSEVDTKDPNKMKREIILSICAETAEGGSVMVGADEKPKTKVKPRNVVVRRVKQKFSLETEKLFDTLKELVTFYQTNYCTVNKGRFVLRNPVKLQEWELLHSNIKMGSLLGEGAFGEVRKGELSHKGKSRDVAVKLTKGTDDLCKAKIREMMREARLMRNLRHKNIVRLYGVAVDEQPLYIVLELVKGGALNSYLSKNKGHVPQNEKMNMCLGAAQGIAFLHKQSIIHRDLAARNCLYSEDKVVKISDFGLSRQMKEYKIKTAVKLPIKWLAPETIVSFVFNAKTDVYSFGVMVHEIFADGAEPWEGVVNGDVKKAVTEGKTLPMKESPDRVRNFCQERVFAKDAEKRADMTEVVRFFEQSVDPTSRSEDKNMSSMESVMATPTTTKKRMNSKN